MTIRKVRLEDAAQVAECVRETYDEYGFTWDPDDYHADLYDLSEYVREAEFWVAEEDGVILGCGGITWHERLPGDVGEAGGVDGTIRILGTSAELVRFYVRPSGRRRGIATSILEMSIEAARVRGVRAIEIWSDKRFQDAHRLYQRYGARIVGDRICDDPDESPEWGLVLEVQEKSDP